MACYQMCHWLKQSMRSVFLPDEAEAQLKYFTFLNVVKGTVV